ncbi:hypothetical protein AArcSl_2410 [Halalkaliarchaeum desulfuricum]|uniref:Uncharacterized protein n=1 Tax=Halalkaliarchaeum desulfuricum TaxID=2055893 RepID=A0A343TLR0_9EURY|nr:hypothetical protein [Halalkaliarchaeum desulfuricum]AUX10032.1 hypothetical protein AArcSl_2410 [Halalkaliarchaeum desulfuricum]
MNTASARLRHLKPGSFRAALQLTIAGLGGLSIVGSILWFVVVFVTMTPGESGFAEGLAILVFGLYALAGFVVLAAGLWIPQREGEGIQFSTRQRKLLAVGVVAPIVGVLAIPIGATIAPPLSQPVISVLVAALAVLISSGPIATLLAVGSKLRSSRNGNKPGDDGARSPP